MTEKRCDHIIDLLRKKLPPEERTIVLGITGGIACGKSLICQSFKDMGAAVLSADELAREAVKPAEEAFLKIVAHFGEDILTADGEIDRTRLAERIFRSPEERQQLNLITHPAIGRLANIKISELRERTDVPLIIYEAPLLYEAKAEDRVDLILVVATTEELQVERLMRRDNLSKEDALRRIAAQMPLADKMTRADIVIENNGQPEEIRKMIQDIFTQLAAFQKKNPPKTGDLHSLSL